MRKILDKFIYALMGIPATWLGACLPCMILSEALGIDFPKEIPVISAILSVALWCGVQALSKGWVRVTLRLFPIILAALVCLKNRSETMEGIRGIIGVLLDKSNEYFGWSLAIPGEASLHVHELTLAWLVPCMILLTLAQLAAEGMAPLCWINMSVFAPAVVVALNEFPRIGLLCLYIGLALYFVVSKDSFALSVREGNRLRLRFAVILMAIIIPANTIIDNAFYDKHIRDAKFRLDLREKMWENMPYLFNTNSDSGKGNVGKQLRMGMSGGALPLGGDVSATGERRLRVTLPAGLGAIYLRGEAFGEYDGTRWRASTRHMFQVSDIDDRGWGKLNVSQLSGYSGALFLDKYPELAEVRFPINRGIMTIEVMDEEETCVFTPYDTMDAYPGKDTSILFPHNSEGCVTAVDPYARTYTCVFIYNNYGLPHFVSYTKDLLAELQPYSGDETYAEMIRLYDDYVYDNYLDIPSECAGVRGLIPLSEGNNLVSAVYAVEEYRSDYEYTLTPGPVPKNKDFIMYFLQERKAGFCVHFASAGVMLFRSLGIPARLAEGYVILPSDYLGATNAGSAPAEMRGAGAKTSGLVPMQTVDLFDNNSHAWVEIYIKGYGWYPIEVTYGSAEGLLEELEQIARTPVATVTPVGSKPTATPTPAGTSPTPIGNISLPPIPTGVPGLSPSVTPKPTGTPKPSGSVTPTPGEGKSKTGPGSKDDDDDHILAAIGLTILCIAVIVGCLYVRRAYVRTKRRSQTFGTDPKNAVIAVCRDMGYLFRLNGIRMEPGETERTYCSRAAESLGHTEELGWLHDIGNRACFGGETITREDRRRAVRLYRSVRATVLRGRSVATRFAWVFLRGV